MRSQAAKELKKLFTFANDTVIGYQIFNGSQRVKKNVIHVPFRGEKYLYVGYSLQQKVKGLKVSRYFDFQPNKAGQRYLDLRREWKTNFRSLRPMDVSDNGCTFQFNAHHGVYSLKVSLPDGSILSKTVEVSNHPGEVLFVFHTFRSKEVKQDISKVLDTL